MQDFYHICCVDTPFYVEKKKHGRWDIVDIARNVIVPKIGAIAEVSSSYRQSGSDPSPRTQERVEQPLRQQVSQKPPPRQD